MGRLLQRPGWRVLAISGPFLYFGGEVVADLLAAPRPGPAGRAVFRTADGLYAYWLVFWVLLIGHRGREWRRRLLPLWGPRVAWLFGWLMLLLHTAAVFELAFGWSHAAAYEHTRRGAGVGWGVFVNYLLLLVWGADAGWLAASPASYGERPGWLSWAVHGLIGFVMFNATVVYGGESARTWGAVGFGGLAALWVWRRRSATPR